MINNLADAFRRAFKNIYESLKEEEIRIVKVTASQLLTTSMGNA